MVQFSSKPWEGKGFINYVRDTVRNRPQVLPIAPFYLIIVPAFAYYAYLVEDERNLQYKPFRKSYVVYRDDDPRIRDIVKFDENGTRVFLEPRSN